MKYFFEEGKIAYANGEYVSLSDVRISPYDLGFLRGYAVFDVIPIIHGKPFLWERHWKRFERSAETLRLSLPVSGEDWREILGQVIDQNPSCGSLRTVLSGGPSDDAYTPRGQETFLILPESKPVLPESIFVDGVKLITLEFSRQLPWAKIANHAFAIKNTPEKKSSGAFEILYVFRGEVYEAATSNVGIVSQGKIVTPKEGVLSGITMDLVLELAKKDGFTIESRSISVDELFGAEEVFLTASSKGVVPVVSIDRSPIGNGTPGSCTKKLLALYREYVKNY